MGIEVEKRNQVAIGLKEVLVGHDLALREEIVRLFEAEPEIFGVRHDLDMRQQRDLLMKRWDRLHELGYYKNTVTSGKAYRYLARLALSEVCEMLDHSLAVKMGVHYGLFGSAVAGLGTPEQARYWLEKVESREVLGCFGLSELGAGSDVRGIRTEAVYMASENCFVLYTPGDEAQKYWIGGAAESATHCTVFANLYVSGVNHGIHCFVTELRRSGEVVPGVTVADCGDKWGLNGVDNGRIWFDRVRVPKENLLAGISQVTASGEFKSRVPDPDERFGVTLGALTGGRVSIIFSGVNQIKVGTTIAARYAQSRQVFGSQLMTIQTHQLRLFPYMCGAVVFNIVGNEIKSEFYAKEMKVSKDMHVMSSGAKALATWEMTKCLQECREACGGQGMLSENRVGPLLSDFNVCMTFEGDNHILIQQVSKAAVAAFYQSRKTGRFGGSLKALNEGFEIDTSDVGALSFVVQMMRRRLALLLESLGTSTESISKDPRQSFQGQLVHFEEVGVAHTEQLLFDAFDRLTKQEPNAALREHMRLCGVLYGLYRIDVQPAFLKCGAIDRKVAADVRSRLLKMCAEFDSSGQMETTLQAFAVPDCLLAPIVGDWIKHNARPKL